MKNLLLVSIVIITCTSCYKYQYATLSGDLEKSKSRQFFFETDSVRIEYAFTGMNCPVQIKVINKLSTPFYVDWSKSALIFNGQTFSYWKDESIINATIDGYDITWSNRVSTNSSNIQGSIIRNEKVSFIPPNSSIVVEPISVRSSMFVLPPSTKEQKTTHVTGARLSKYVFSLEAAPLQFRSYLTFAATEDFEEQKVINNQFWVSKVIQTSVAPETLPNKGSDQFYVSEFTGFAEFMIVIVGLALIVAYSLTN